MLLYQRQLVGSELAFVIDVGDGGHKGAEDDLGVVLGGQQKRVKP